MARVTVEDCLNYVHNRFELVHVATKRARQIIKGSKPLIDPRDEKPTVIALREVAQGDIEFEQPEEEPS